MQRSKSDKLPQNKIKKSAITENLKDKSNMKDKQITQQQPHQCIIKSLGRKRTTSYQIKDHDQKSLKNNKKSQNISDAIFQKQKSANDDKSTKADTKVKGSFDKPNNKKRTYNKISGYEEPKKKRTPKKILKTEKSYIDSPLKYQMIELKEQNKNVNKRKQQNSNVSLKFKLYKETDLFKPLIESARSKSQKPAKQVQINCYKGHPNNMLSQKVKNQLLYKQLTQDEDIQTDAEILISNKKECMKDLQEGIQQFLDAIQGKNIGQGGTGESNPFKLIKNLNLNQQIKSEKQQQDQKQKERKKY